MKIFDVKFTLKTDKGNFKISTFVTGNYMTFEEALIKAKDIIINTENCPESAIKKIIISLRHENS